MPCEEIGYPYLDSSDGVHKYVGPGGEIECATLNVFANIPDVPIVVSEQDDNGDSDGLTDFCRLYFEVCSVTVMLTAPPTAGVDNEHDFRRWVVDGFDQPLSQHTVEVPVCDGLCHAAYAKYGDTIIIPGEGPCAGLQISTVATIRGAIGYSHMPGGSQWMAGCLNSCWAIGPGHSHIMHLQLDELPTIKYLREPNPETFCAFDPQCCPPNCPVACPSPPQPPFGWVSHYAVVGAIQAFTTVGCECSEDGARIILFNTGLLFHGSWVYSQRVYPFICGAPGPGMCGGGDTPFGCGPFMATIYKDGPGGDCPHPAQRLLSTPIVGLEDSIGSDNIRRVEYIRVNL